MRTWGKEYESPSGNAGCGSGGIALTKEEMARIRLRDGRVVLMNNHDPHQARLALTRTDWQPHERVLIIDDGKYSYVLPRQVEGVIEAM